MVNPVTPSRLAAISAYRNLLKTQRDVFKNDNGAIQARVAAKKETHARFMQYKEETNCDKLALAEQVVSLLKKNVSLAELKNEGGIGNL
ncbi:hypothetical protein PHYBLDRAFT_139259 [Phycomyces blakesleeanus NRRL 1555(-)]|uniref:Uncharacterized protein n=1 Tax=Phycomyces blakesleeanus (strain ATCC 8743b / DSM 1359 / FGSC 10004 / NBRC 33097 / NRRL 1555) TaxID=763407 RepID=A0A162V0R2_PHYB8|nr:hypothetical protein PHYBLDRAFT_139259 [Phycomyces blakesleeanus NRRL 1555(-)]OAD79223.1 hypothetical protein PHYBLDRAFT_139259 [Phycomyces blakesleeanus NRRL 1555(-)]|eukprot:XP_018297263.1 hypothetical protein PHYBLDRAFT_139259 [Phycomyces blakesleeanus NRRL 1555(-)]